MLASHLLYVAFSLALKHFTHDEPTFILQLIFLMEMLCQDVEWYVNLK